MKKHFLLLLAATSLFFSSCDKKGKDIVSVDYTRAYLKSSENYKNNDFRWHNVGDMHWTLPVVLADITIPNF